MIYYWAQSDIPVKTFNCQNLLECSLLISVCLNRFLTIREYLEETLWLFVFVMGFIFQQRRSQHIIKIYRTTKSKVMAIRICVRIRFPLSSSMIYYRAQSDIRGKAFNCQNLLECSFLISGCLNRFMTLHGDLEEMLWLFVFVIGFIFQQRRSQYIVKIYRTTESKVMVIRICIGIQFPLSSYMIYYGPQLEIRVKTFACQNLAESSLFISRCLQRFLALCEDPEERLWPFAFVMDFIFQRRSQHIINIYKTIEPKVMAVRICVGIRFLLLSSMIYYGPQSVI